MKNFARAAALTLAVTAVAIHGPAEAAKPGWTKNCTALNKKFPHGVGRAAAVDKTSSGSPVTTFRRSNKLYKTAMKYNKGLDRDRDKIACEKK